MKSTFANRIQTFIALFVLLPVAGGVSAEEPVSLEQLKRVGAQRSAYLNWQPPADGETSVPAPRIEQFNKSVAPIFTRKCVGCHGEDLQEGNIRIDTLDPDLFHGKDVSWWLEILAVLSKGEMPPADEEPLTAEELATIVDWLSTEVHTASRVRRSEGGHSSFRRMTSYEYNYALQDLLGLPYEFSRDLPPEPTSEDGFQNSSETLHMSAMQFATYRESARKALRRAIVRGERPEPVLWAVSMEDAAKREWERQNKDEQKIREKHKDDPVKLEQELERHAKRIRSRPRNAHYLDRETGRAGRASWSYGGARYAFAPVDQLPTDQAESPHVAIIPPGQKLIVELGDRVPDEGTLRVRIRASRALPENDDADEHAKHLPSLQLEFGWQASNDSHASSRVSKHDVVIDAPPKQPRFYQWEIPMGDVYPRNSVRKISQMGDLPSPSEYIKFVNSSVRHGDIQIDYVEVTAPVYESWPPPSHQRILFESAQRISANPTTDEEEAYARELLPHFMSRAWRREVTPTEVRQKLELFRNLRPVCEDFEDTIIEVFATVLSSPKFLYLVRRAGIPDESDTHLSPSELATRLSMFLWSSLPDDRLQAMAEAGELGKPDVLRKQVQRMLQDARAQRFPKHFVRQWLGMQLLDYLDVDRKEHPYFDESLKEAMYNQSFALFDEMLANNRSVLDFIHADYLLTNERLAKHYGLQDVRGNTFRRVAFGPDHQRGGLLTQAGLLAMNSDGKDSHPLKRGIWMLESLLNDPPPPPPAAVPEIDIADPEIAKLTLKERIEDHRDDPACLSCHKKIDPWGIAFENFDAGGRWRDEIKGKPVDASSELFNGEELDGIDGLKRYLLEKRQDQFVRALVHKMTTYALGRPLTFGDRSSVDQITAELRKQGDGLATMIGLIVESELFRRR